MVFDKDNTLTDPYKMDLNPIVDQGLNECKEVFGVKNIAILSNSVGSSDDVEYKVTLSFVLTSTGGFSFGIYVRLISNKASL